MHKLICALVITIPISIVKSLRLCDEKSSFHASQPLTDIVESDYFLRLLLTFNPNLLLLGVIILLFDLTIVIRKHIFGVSDQILNANQR